jgi:hypothetical protein
VSAVVLLAALLAAPVPPTRVTGARPPRLKTSGVPVARVSFGEGRIDHSYLDGAWKRLAEGERIRTGDRVRTGADATARIAFPWTALTLASASTLAVAASAVLSTVLEEGRVEQAAEGGDIIKLLTPEAEVRGRGRVLVRRQAGVTLVTVVEGRCQVSAGDAKLSLEKGQGCRVRGGGTPVLQELPPAPRGLAPASDPRYFLKGQGLVLAWERAAPGYHVQILPVGSPEVLLARDLAGPPLRVEFPWLGTFRWRVSARDAEGNEGVPSADGLFCVVEK